MCAKAANCPSRIGRIPTKSDDSTKVIRELQTAGQVLAFISERGKKLNSAQAVQCLWRLGMLRSPLQPEDSRYGGPLWRLLKVIRRLAQRGHLDSKGLSNVLLALSYLEGEPPGLREVTAACADSLSMHVNGASALDLATGAWALARARDLHMAMLQSVAEASVVKIRDFGPLELSKLAWGFATLDVKHLCLFHVLAQEAVSKRRGCSPQQGLSNLAWSFAKLGIKDARLFDAIAEQALLHLGKFKMCKELSQLVWAFAKLNVAHARLLLAVADEVAASPGELDPHGLANIAWAFSTCSLRAAGLFRFLAREAVARSGMFKPQELANLAWAYAKLDEFEPDLFHSIAKEASMKLRSFLPQNLANLAWAFATMTIADEHLFDALMEEAVGKLGSFTPHGLSNIMWAAAHVSTTPVGMQAAADELVKRLQALEAHSLGGAELAELAKAISGAIWALGFAGLPSEALRMQAITALARVGRVLDRRVKAVGIQPLVPLGLQSGAGEPHIELGLPDRLVIHKPPGWEVLDAAEVRSGQPLTGYVGAMLPKRQLPILDDARRHYGFMHRLDVPNSGLILAATTYEAYYDLELQLSTGDMAREYVGLCRGWPPPQRRDIAAPVSWVGGLGDRRPTVVHSWRGKPSRTWLKALAHAVAPGAVACGLLALRLATGRRHQIRAHTAHCGLALVGDAKYGSSTAASADAAWCSRGFLHRLALGFCDAAGVQRRAMAPLPLDLASALQQLEPRGRRSGEALARCLSSQVSQAWEECEPLPTGPPSAP